ncbi:TonB-dependent siderophore receptor [Paraferrimonas sp. SM1919]|uniref:TonB-dependent receptor plug domain-containing protein n=1 Tax=Paraferrimonas sp. SM1919 TaxID=2662263 RepID=UPI0013D53572|nr:TonB-dependent receptor [Paraferrimonas sp. SM1919]
MNRLPSCFALSALTLAISTPLTVIAEEVTIETEETLVVVGSRANPRSALDSAVPVDVISADALQNSASMNGEIAQLLHSLLPSINFPRQSNSDTADIVRPAQLRGLSPDHTLVLVNGKRRHTTSVLNTGGKTGRGSAPVDLNTIPFSAIKRIEVLRDGAAAQYGSDAIAGVINIVLKDADQGGSISATYGAHVTDFKPTDSSIVDGQTTLITANKGISLDNGFINVSAQYRDRKTTNRAGFDQVPFWEVDAGNPDVVGKVNYKVGDPEEQGFALMVNAEKEISDNISLYGFANHSNRQALGSNFYRYPNDTWSNVAEIYPDGYIPMTDGTTKDDAVVIGIKGSHDWDWDLSANYGRSFFDLNLKDSLNASMGAASPTEFHLGTFDYSQLVINADASKLVNLIGFDATIAVGAEYRTEFYKTTAGDEASYSLGANIAAPGSQGSQGLRPVDTVDVSRNAAAIYADVEVELTSDLLASTALRYEDYSDFGDTFNSKLALKYSLTDFVNLRGAASTGFRAPSLVQNHYQASTSDFGDNGALTTFAIVAPTSELAQAVGAKSLKAETSTNYSLGVVFNSDFGLSATVDAYLIDIKDRISLNQGVYTAPDGTPINELPEAAARPGIQGVQFFTNAIDTRTQGVDVVVDYNVDSLGLSLAYNHNTTEITNGGTSNVEEINTLESAAPKNKLIFTANHSWNGLNSMLRVTRYGETERVFDFGGGYHPQQTFSANVSVDVDVNYQFANGLSIALGANNLLDQYPDLSSDEINYFGNFPYDVIPPIGLNGRYVYSRINYKF